MSEENKSTLTYEDKEYVVEDLPERGQMLVGLLASARAESSDLNAKLLTLQAAEITFSKELEQILTSDEQEDLD